MTYIDRDSDISINPHTHGVIPYAKHTTMVDTHMYVCMYVCCMYVYTHIHTHTHVCTMLVIKMCCTCTSSVCV